MDKYELEELIATLSTGNYQVKVMVERIRKILLYLLQIELEKIIEKQNETN